MNNNRLEEIRARLDRLELAHGEILELASTDTERAYENTISDLIGDARILLSLLDARPAVAADGEGNASGAEWESVSEAAAEIARLTKWQDLCFELLSEVRQWVAPGSIRDTDAPRALQALLSERAELKQRATPVSADAPHVYEPFADEHGETCKTCRYTNSHLHVNDARELVEQWHEAEDGHRGYLLVDEERESLAQRITAYANQRGEERYGEGVELAAKIVEGFDGWIFCTCSECKTDARSHAVLAEASLLRLAAEVRALSSSEHSGEHVARIGKR